MQSMPCKDTAKQLEYQRKWYAKHSKREIQKVAERKQKLKFWMEDYKSSIGCSKCGENHPSCLEFHHLDRSDKTSEISRMVNHGASKKKILEEASKCVILCSNCHRKLHYERQDSGTHLDNVRFESPSLQLGAIP